MTIRTLALGASAVLCVQCILLAVWQRFSGIAQLWGVVCLCYTGYTGLSLLYELAGTGGLWPHLSQASYCVMLLVVLRLHQKLSSLPRHTAVFLALLCLFPTILLSFQENASLDCLYRYSRLWIALLMLALSARTLRCGHCRSKRYMYSLVGFDIALLLEQALPCVWSPTASWLMAAVGLTLVLATTGVLDRDIAHICRERQELRENARLHSTQLSLLREQARIQRKQLEDARVREHEVKHHLLAIQAQLLRGDPTLAERTIGEWLGADRPVCPAPFTRNSLIDLVVFAAKARADRLEVRFERALLGIPERLSIEDRDLSTILMNLLDNALDACAAMPPGAERWARLEIRYFQGALSIAVENSYSGVVHKRLGLYPSAKGEGHGYGLRNVRRVARGYGGTVKLSRDAGVFRVHVRINPGNLPDNSATL